jgi:hypothetical protein
MNKLKTALAAIGAALVFLAGWFFRGLFARKTSPADIKTPEEVKLEIENTPAGDLVSAAPNADQLRANADGIAGRAKQRLRDSAGKIISGNAGSGTDGSGGIGN